MVTNPVIAPYNGPIIEAVKIVPTTSKNTKGIFKLDYIKDNIIRTINRHGFGVDNYKDITTYYRQEGFIIKKHKRKYKKENIGKILNYKEYKISEDYHKNEKYLNQTGYYKDFDSKLYNPFLRGKCNVKSLYK